jgi:hypothetical protein
MNLSHDDVINLCRLHGERTRVLGIKMVRPKIIGKYPVHKSDEEYDHTPLDFGKYKGQTPSQVAEHDPGWIVYIAGVRNIKFASETLINDCKKDME